MDEVGIYRVAGILRDVRELRLAFDTGGTGPSLDQLFFLGVDMCNWSPSTMQGEGMGGGGGGGGGAILRL